MNLQKMKRERPTAYKEILDKVNLPMSQEDKGVELKLVLEQLKLGTVQRRKLFPAGRTFYIPSGVAVHSELQDSLITEFDAICLSSISMHSAMLSDHMAVFQAVSQNNNL